MTRILQHLANRLGVAPPNAGEATTPELRCEQLWSQSLLVFVILGSVALIVWLYRQEGKASVASKLMLAGLRIALVLLAILMLHEPVLSVARTGLPFLTILVDDSASQRIADQYDEPNVKAALDALAANSVADASAAAPAIDDQTQTTRLKIAQGLILKDRAKLIRELLRKEHKVKLYRVSTALTPLYEVDRPNQIEKAAAALRSVEASGSQSRLGDAVRQVLTEFRGAPPSAIVLLTDGQTTEGEPLSKAAELAGKKEVPLFTIGLGSGQPPRDIELKELLVDDVVFVDDAVRFQVKLHSKGFKGEKIVVHLKELEPGTTDPKAARTLESKEVKAPADGESEPVEIIHHPKATGERTFIIEVDKYPRELQTDNNRIERLITVRKEKLKVLFVDSEPRYEFRYLKNYLERDETIDLNVVLLSSDPEYSEQDRSALPTFPAAKDALFAYDVVLFGDADVSFLSHSQMQNLVEFVTQKGGGILFVAGELFDPLSYRGTPLELLLPVELSDGATPPLSGRRSRRFAPS